MTNKEVVLKFYEEVFNGWDVSNIDEFMADDYIHHNPTAETGKAGFLKFAVKFLAMKPHMEIKHIIEEGDLVCVFFKCTMGNGMENKVFDLYRLRDGKLCEHWDCVEHDIGKITPVHDNGWF
jgi:predicted SnoaL-like aldol condensation-catalyzing enzyme